MGFAAIYPPIDGKCQHFDGFSRMGTRMFVRNS